MEIYKQKIIIFFIILYSFAIYSQKKLVVYQVEGNVYYSKSKKQLYTGSLLEVNNSILIEKGSAIFIDENANMYNISKEGKTSFADVKKSKIKNESKSVSKRYLSYVYKKFLKKEEKKSIYGGVFRGNDKLQLPNNLSYFTVDSFVDFKWNSIGEKTFYLWILNAKNEKIIGKYKMNFSNSLGILLPLKKGVYKWTVTTDNTLESNKEFNIFEIVSKKEFDKREKDKIYEVKKRVELLLKD
ncbi:MAG: hypothetical protein V3V28_10180 [Polaribacter sp.]|uniref:hypothetical protein n=1 Tax=Polaribacter sp. TaxID=1920175 RepID=UPI002F35F657